MHSILYLLDILDEIGNLFRVHLALIYRPECVTLFQHVHSHVLVSIHQNGLIHLHVESDANRYSMLFVLIHRHVQLLYRNHLNLENVPNSDLMN